MTPVEQTRERLQHAIRAGSYAEAQHCLAQYTRAVNAALAAAGPDGRSAIGTLSSALDLLQWADRAVRCGRAHAAAELARLASARPYRPASQSATTFQMEA